MNIERNRDNVERRVLKHRALSDPARLRIVDLLTLGDLSPSEIRAAVGIPSNLVAHHLNTLEAAGIVTRSRSEADKRRSYIHLVSTALNELVPESKGGASRVVFVCTANSARSQLAAALWHVHSSIPATSGGTKPADRIEPGAIDTARRHGLTLDHEYPQLLRDVQRSNDFVITLCDNAHEEIGATGDLHWSIPDPVRIGTIEAFEDAYAELDRRITYLAQRLTPA